MNREILKTKSAKVLLSLLAFCFILTSVSGVVFLKGKYDLITLKGKAVSIGDFYKDLVSERRKIWMQNPSEKTLKYLISEGFIKGFLSRRIDRLLLEKAIKSLKIKFTESQILKSILVDTDFFVDNKFDLTKYKAVLKANNLTEKEYFDQMQDVNAINFLTMILSSDYLFNEDTIKKVQDIKNQEKVVDLYTVNKNELKVDVEDPSKEEVAEYYKSNLDKFLIQEKKKIDYIFVNKKFDNKKILTEDEINQYYNEHQNLFKIEKTFDIFDIRTANESDLKKLVSFLKNNKNVDLSKVIYNFLKKENTEISSKTLTADGLDYLYNEKIKNLNINEVSDIIKHSDTQFGVVFVNSIKEEQLKPLSEVRNLIVNTLKSNEKAEIIAELNEFVLSKSTLKDLAKELQLEPETLGKLTKNEFNQNTLAVDKTAYNLDLNQFSKIIEVEDGYYIYSVSEIENEKLPTLEEEENNIKSIILQDKIEEKRKELLSKLINGGINKIKYKLETKLVVKQTDNNFSEDFIKDVYSVEQGAFTQIYTKDNEFYFAVLKNNKLLFPYEEDFNDFNTIKANINNDIDNEIKTLYLNYLQKKYKVKINYDLLKYIQ